MGVCEVLIPLTNSLSSEVQGNSAAALGNLSSKGELQSKSVVGGYLNHMQMAEQRTTITLLSMTSGTSLRVECISISSAS